MRNPTELDARDAGSLREINREHHESTKTLDRLAWVYDTRLLESQFRDLDALDATFVATRPTTRLLLLWEPPSLDERIANQAGMLTLMNSATPPQNAFLGECARQHPMLVHRIIITANAKPEIRAILDQNNISERTLYPGLPGLCAWLKRYYAKAW